MSPIKNWQSVFHLCAIFWASRYGWCGPRRFIQTTTQHYTLNCIRSLSKKTLVKNKRRNKSCFCEEFKMESAKLSFDFLVEIACLLLHIFGKCSLRIKTDKMLSWKDENRRRRFGGFNLLYKYVVFRGLRGLFHPILTPRIGDHVRPWGDCCKECWGKFLEELERKLTYISFRWIFPLWIFTKNFRMKRGSL